MSWVALRQFRGQAVVGTLVIAALTLSGIIGGASILHYYDTFVAPCAKYGSCSSATENFLFRYGQFRDVLDGIVLVAPGLIGIFWGAPLVARELESGTFRLAWTQSVSRTRWLGVKVGVVGALSVAFAGLGTLAVTWSLSPLDRVNAAPFGTFDQRDVVVLAYAAFGFTLGVAAGVVLRRSIAAMGLTLALFVGVRMSISNFVRPRLMTPAQKVFPYVFSPSGAEPSPKGWILTETVVNGLGKPVANDSALGSAPGATISVTRTGVNIGGVGSCPDIHGPSDLVRGSQSPAQMSTYVQRCIDELHIREIVRYQPLNRYWPFQIYESLIFVVLAVAVAALAFWWLRRRLG